MQMKNMPHHIFHNLHKYISAFLHICTSVCRFTQRVFPEFYQVAGAHVAHGFGNRLTVGIKHQQGRVSVYTPLRCQVGPVALFHIDRDIDKILVKKCCCLAVFKSGGSQQLAWAAPAGIGVYKNVFVF